MRWSVWLIVLFTFAVAAPAQAGCLKPYSWVAGQTSLCKGAVVYGDYVGDDYGADAGESNKNRIGSLSPGAGDQEYPAGQEATADLIRLTLQIRGRRLHVAALLHALYKPGESILGLALDTDANQETGGGEWGDFGIQSKGWEKLSFFEKGDVRRNTITGSIPLPKGKRWRIQAAVANAETGQVMNVAFRPDDHPGASEDFSNALNDSSAGTFFEDDQAEALADGDISDFGYTVRVRDMKRKRTRPHKAVTGMRERVYTSRYTIKPGEGMSYEGVPGRGGADNNPKLGFEQAFNFLGRYQPYGIYIPKAKGRLGMQMVFHGSSSNLSALIAQPGMQAALGDGMKRILVTPEGRGTEAWGSDISERDMLDVMADVRRTYSVDSDRVFAGGYSQGGYVTYRMASLHPHLFAGAIDWVGFTGNGANGSPVPGADYTAGAIGNGVDLIKNMLNVPAVMLYAAGDELVHVWTAQAMNDAFAATDNLYRFYQHPTAEHLTFAALDDWKKEAEYTKDLTLAKNPARVVFTTAPFLDAPQFEIRHDRAYWISAIRTAGGEEDYGTVDLTAGGCGGSVPVTERVSGSGDDPVPWTLDEQRAESMRKLPKSPGLKGTLTNVSSLGISSKLTCTKGEAFSYDIVTDKPVTVLFSDGRTLKLKAGRARGTLAR